MLTLLFSIALFAISTPATQPGVTFDEARAKAHYEAFIYTFLKSDWPADDTTLNQMKHSAARQRPDVKVSDWPIDPTRGVYCNTQARPKLDWAMKGVTERPKGRPFHELELCSVSNLSSSYMYDFMNDVAPKLCVERPGSVGAYQGAAACYFWVQAEYRTPGFWVALREVDGKVVIAGVLEHKEFMDEPEKDRRLKPFLDAIEKRFGPAPDPKAPKPGKRP